MSSEMKSTTGKDSCQENVKFRTDNIEKSPNDKKDYRGLILSNEMKVLLISDPTTDKSAAALDVQVGELCKKKKNLPKKLKIEELILQNLFLFFRSSK